MIIAFQIVLLITILVGAFGTIGEKEDKGLRDRMTAICITSTLIFFISVVWL